jgi:hypothetical protein
MVVFVILGCPWRHFGLWCRLSCCLVVVVILGYRVVLLSWLSLGIVGVFDIVNIWVGAT